MVLTAVSQALSAYVADRGDTLDLDELLAPVLADHGWPSVREALFSVLESEDPHLWGPATAALWGAVLDRRDLDSDRAIALVYHRLADDPSGQDANLAWSIASELKGVSYLSDYDPREDPKVKDHLAALRR